MIDTVVKRGRNTTANSDLITVINSLTEIVDGLGDYPTGESRQELLLKIPIGNAIKPCEEEIGSFQTTAEEDKDPLISNGMSLAMAFNLYKTWTSSSSKTERSAKSLGNTGVQRLHF
jgi:hypothetical protein